MGAYGTYKGRPGVLAAIFGDGPGQFEGMMRVKRVRVHRTWSDHWRDWRITSGDIVYCRASRRVGVH